MEELLNQLSVYIQYIIMIVGCIEFIKNVIVKKKLNVYSFFQIGLCLIAGIFITINNNNNMNSVNFIIGSIYYWLLFISLSTLFYDLIVKKIKKGN